uniref:Uncharacterized protein n=1 Tax=Romanomermis culicivorax TaxID=13658 RepID=A0A915ITN1_ROMCU
MFLQYSRIGYKGLIYAGNFTFLLSSIIYASSTSYTAFLLARSIHGIGSATGIISGLSLLASTFEEDAERSKYMGIAMGGMAVGVLVGYPLGGTLYNFFGKTTPFVFVTILCLICTSTAFLPDSFGYLLGTNFFGSISIKIGRWICALSSHIMIALSLFLGHLHAIFDGTEWNAIDTTLANEREIFVSFGSIPMAKNVTHLIVPHFGVGLGIAVIDASLMPLLAWLVERRHNASYCLIYSLTQMAVCLAYGLGPLLGGWLMEMLSFEISHQSMNCQNKRLPLYVNKKKFIDELHLPIERINPDVSTVSFYQDYGSEKYKFLYESD